FPPPPVALDARDPNQIDRVLELLRGPADGRPPAFDWLLAANVDHPRRGEVAKQMESLVNDEWQRPFRRFHDAYYRWATKDNLPTLLKLAASTDIFQKDHRHKSMAILAQFKEPRAADSMAARLADHWDSDAANKALTDMGPIAESAVLKYMNDKDARARD